MVSEFYEMYRDRHQLAEKWKQTGKNVFGYFCLYVPQELIYAANVIPVRIRGSMDNPNLADALLPRFVCSYHRSCLHEALDGKYKYLDGVIFTQRCDVNRNIGNIWTETIKIPYSWHVAMPRKGTEEAIEMYTEELRLFKGSLEQYLGREISDQSILQAIEVYNENRSMRRQVYQLALRDAPPLTGSHVFEIMLSGLIMPKDEHNKLLRKLLDNIPSDVEKSNGARLLITGNTLENVDVLRTVEKYGGQIVADDYCFGTHDCWSEIDKNQDPLRGIAEYYLQRRIPSPCEDTLERRRIEHVLQLVKDYRVKGVIQATQHYCDNYLFETPILEERLSERGIPLLNIEIDDSELGLARIESIVEPFIEIIS